MLKLTIRTIAMFTGFLGVVIAFIINIMYSSFHVLVRVAGITNDQSHFFWGLVIVFIGLIGSLFALFLPTVGMVLLLVAGIAFFFVTGWWALLASPFLLLAALLAYRYNRAPRQVYTPTPTTPR